MKNIVRWGQGLKNEDRSGKTHYLWHHQPPVMQKLSLSFCFVILCYEVTEIGHGRVGPQGGTTRTMWTPRRWTSRRRWSQWVREEGWGDGLQDHQGKTIFFQYVPIFLNQIVKVDAYLIFVIFFTRAKFLENKIYTEKAPIFRVKSVKNAIFSRKICRKCQFFALNL